MLSRDALGVGRDPNNAQWITIRYPHDWEAATLEGLLHDPVRGVVELSALPWAPPDAASRPACEWLPPLAARDANGIEYRSDPWANEILRRTCDSTPRPLAGLGGPGWQTGRLCCPLGVTIDRRGWLYVADSGNHRVQVVRPDDGSVVVVLGNSDTYGRPVASDRPGGMREPVDVAVDDASCRTYVADLAAGAIHVFDGRFRFLHRFVPRPASQPAHVPLPVAVAVVDDGTLWIVDARWPRLLHTTAEGVALGEASPGAIAIDRFAPLRLTPRFVPEGVAVIGPLDGRAYDQAWHRIIVEADAPPGTAIEVQTFASNDPGAAAMPVPWAPDAPVAIPDRGEDSLPETSRLVLSDTGRWRRHAHGAFRRARPLLARFSGDGPGGSDRISLPGEVMRWVRVGDAIDLVSETATATAVIADIPAAEVRFSATGATRVYGAGTAVWLRERGGRAPVGAPVLLFELRAGDVVDFSTVTTDGVLHRRSWPHGAAALMFPGDVIEVSEGGDSTTAIVDEIDFVDSDIALTAPVGGDFSSSAAYLVNTPGRLVIDDAGELGVVPPNEEVRVIDERGSGETAEIKVVDALSDTLAALWLVPGTAPATLFDTWRELRMPEPAATDRGRYLWIKLTVRGARAHAANRAATATPSIRGLRALLPRFSYLRYLPGTFARRDDEHDPSGALFIERFLAMFEGRLTNVEACYEAVSRMLNPQAASPEWLRFMAAWLDIVFDPSWPIERRRTLLTEAPALYRRRGTPEGLRRYVEIYTGIRPQLVEGFQVRPRSSAVLGVRSILGCAALTSIDTPPIRRYAHRFTLVAYTDDHCRVDVIESGIKKIVDSVKPAHTEVDIRLVKPEASVGLQSTIGLDFSLGGGHEAPGFVLGEGSRDVAGQVHPVLGREVLGNQVRTGVAVGHAGAAVDESFRLT